MIQCSAKPNSSEDAETDVADVRGTRYTISDESAMALILRTRWRSGYAPAVADFCDGKPVTKKALLTDVAEVKKNATRFANDSAVKDVPGLNALRKWVKAFGRKAV